MFHHTGERSEVRRGLPGDTVQPGWLGAERQQEAALSLVPRILYRRGEFAVHLTSRGGGEVQKQ